jgi:hypothetical protein
MSWVLIYIATNFLAPIPLISAGIDDFIFQFAPKSMNSSRRFPRKSPNRLKPTHTSQVNASLSLASIRPPQLARPLLSPAPTHRPLPLSTTPARTQLRLASGPPAAPAPRLPRLTPTSPASQSTRPGPTPLLPHRTRCLSTCSSRTHHRQPPAHPSSASSHAQHQLASGSRPPEF